MSPGARPPATLITLRNRTHSGEAECENTIRGRKRLHRICHSRGLLSKGHAVGAIRRPESTSMLLGSDPFEGSEWGLRVNEMVRRLIHLG